MISQFPGQKLDFTLPQLSSAPAFIPPDSQAPHQAWHLLGIRESRTGSCSWTNLTSRHDLDLPMMFSAMERLLFEADMACFITRPDPSPSKTQTRGHPFPR